MKIKQSILHLQNMLENNSYHFNELDHYHLKCVLHVLKIAYVDRRTKNIPYEKLDVLTSHMDRVKEYSMVGKILYIFHIQAQTNNVVTIGGLREFLLKCKITNKRTEVNWNLTNMCKQGLIERISYEVYSLTEKGRKRI